MDYRDEIYAYEDEAEDQFDHYYEDEDEGYYEDEYYGLEGHEDEDEIEEIHYIGGYPEAAEYDNFTETSIGRIDPNDRTLTIRVKNEGSTDAEAIIFGGNQNATQPAGVSVDVEESSHNEVREESKANPFKIAGMKYAVSNPLQFDSILNISRRTATGSSTVRVYQPRNATSPQNFSQQLIDDDNFEMDVTGQDSLRLKILANTTAVFTFTIKARANMGNILSGNNVAELSSTPRTTGLPQIDLVRRNQPTAFGLAKPKQRSSAQPQQVIVRKLRSAASAKPVRSRVKSRVGKVGSKVQSVASKVRPGGRPGKRVLSKLGKFRRR